MAIETINKIEKRQYWLDVARSIAIISITFNHALSRSFATNAGTQEEYIRMTVFGSFLKAVLYVFSRIGVPLFLMISGALLLGRKYEEKEITIRFLKHNWWELLRTTEIWLFIMFWYLQFSSDSVLRNEGIFRALVEMCSTMLFINQTTLSSMWYMPMILLVYLMIPVIAVGIQKLGGRYFLIIFIIMSVCGMILPNINTGISALHGKTFTVAFSITDLLSIYFLYILAGYWISRNKMEKIKTVWVTMIFLISFLATVLFQLWMYSGPSDYGVRYADIGILISGVSLFELIRRKAANYLAIENMVTKLSKSAFGIFFLHICIMTFISTLVSRITAYRGFSSFLILELGSFLFSILFIWLTSKNRFIKKYLYLIR